MDQTLTALLSLVHGTARASLEVRRSRGIDEQDDARWWSSVEPALTIAMGDSTRFPTASRVARALGEATGSSDDPEGAYRRGLALLIDGLEHRHQPGTAS